MHKNFMEKFFSGKVLFMKNSLIKRSITGTLALAMVFSAYSCKGSSEESSGDESIAQSTETANNVITNSFSSVDIDIDIPAEYIEQMSYIKDSSKVLILGGNSSNSSLYLTDIDFSGFNEIPLNFTKPENSQSYLRTSVAPDGSIYVFFTLIDYGDFKLPDYEDPDFDYENFDYDAMNEAAKYSYTLYKLSSDGQIVSESPVDLSKYGDDSYGTLQVNNIVAGNNGKLVITSSGENETYLIMNEDGTINGEIEGDDINWINSFTTDLEGNILCYCYTSKGSEIKCVDVDNKKFTDSDIDINENDILDINSISTGIGEYTLFMTNQSGLYGVGKDKKPVEIINWIDSDMDSSTVQQFIGCEDGDFIVYINNYSTNTSGFVRLTRRNPEELANQTIITVATMGNDSSITSKITEFNKSNSQYRLKVADYSKYNEWDSETEKQTNSAEKQLKMDIISGDVPDMIISYDYNIISELAHQGTYTDLYTFLEKDEELSKDDIMPNVLKASEIDGKLYSLSANFQVSTLACKTKFFDKENWTPDELIDTMHNNPDMKLTSYTNSKESVFDMLVNFCSDEFIDNEKNECNFDSDEFKKVLEFCNEFPDEDDEIDWENASDDELNAYWNEQETMCLNDKALLSDVTFYELTQYSIAKNVTFGDDITLVGIPSSNGKGALLSLNNSMAILDSSPSKEACWEFVKSFFKEEEQTNNYGFGLPSLVSAFNKAAEDSMHKPYYIDENGKKVEYDNTYFVNDKEINVSPLTKEEKDFVVDYIKNADRIYIGYNEEVSQILKEEATKYFKGEASSQQTVDKLQSRISILISEQS